MGSTEEEISEFDLEFSEEEVLEAIKKKGGRPSNRTREIRERIHEAKRLTDILGILDSGILEQMVRTNLLGSDRSDPGRTSGVESESKKSTEGFTADLLKRSGLVGDKFLNTNKDLLALSDDVVSNALITYSPPIIAIIGSLAGIYIAETQVEDFPPVLHTGMELLTQVVRLLTILSGFISTGLGGIVDFITDPVGAIQEELDKVLGDVFLETSEEKQAALKKVIDKAKKKKEEQVGIYRKKGPG